MDGLKRTLRWTALLWKRLYKKLTFLLLLAVIPALVLGYGMVAKEDSGLVIIALATEAEEVEPLTRSVWDELMESQVMLCIECESPETAEVMVREGKADVAWIFAEDLETKIYDFAARRTRKNAFVTVLEPDNRTILKMMREVLSGVMFPHCSEALYLHYIRENAPELSHLSDEQLLDYYRNMEFDEGLFVFTDLEGNATESEDTQYLLTPVRGMLAVVVVLSGLATAMYYIRDAENGTFAWIPQRRQVGVELGCQLISIVNVTAVVLLSLAMTGQTVAMGREVAVAALYCLCVAAFAMLVRRVTGGMRGLGMATPLLVVLMLTVCPVFFDLGAVRQLQFIFPPTYFINGAYNDKYLFLMPLYTLALLVLCRLLDKLRKMD